MSDHDAGARWIERFLGVTVPSAGFRRASALQSDGNPSGASLQERVPPREPTGEQEDGLREAQRDDRELRALFAMYDQAFGTQLDEDDTFTIGYWLAVLRKEGTRGTYDKMLLMKGQFKGSGSAMTDRSEKGEAKEERKRREHAEDSSVIRKDKEKEWIPTARKGVG